VTDVDIAGVGMHPFGRFPGMSLRDLGGVAALAALKDSNIGVKDVEAAFVSNSLGGALQGQEMIRGQTFLRDIGIGGIPIFNVENACAGASTALHLAIASIRAEQHRCVLVLGVEKMFVAERSRTLKALQSAADIEVIADLGLQFTAVYAMRLQERLARGELELRHLVDVTIKAHANGALNPYAQFQNTVTREEVLQSRMIAEPLTLLMCSSIGDGAAAAIVTKAGYLASSKPTVRVRASKIRSGNVGVADSEPTAQICSRLAYEEAGVGADDIDLFEVHDAMAPGELAYYEELGLCSAGEVGKLLDEKVTALGGRHPVNPSGGLSARGHPIGATGLAQIAELTWQLRREAGARQVTGTRFGLAQNSGGWLEGESAASVVHILERLSN
jgi:acetyl-CoA acyltransferase